MDTTNDQTTEETTPDVIETMKDIATGEGSVMDIIADETKDLADKTIAPLTEDVEDEEKAA
jgi:hypothetical protein